LALGDVTGDGRKELLYSAYDGAVRCLQPEQGEILWEAQLGGFTFSLAAQDIEGDGRAEVFAACADGKLYALSPEGETLWAFDSPLPMCSVAVGRRAGGEPFVVCGGVDHKVSLLSADGQLAGQYDLEILTNRLAVGDFDGDGQDEVFVLDSSREAELLAVEGNTLRRVWRKELTVPPSRRNWENPAMLFIAHAVEIGDVNGDGRPEILLGSWCQNDQAVQALTASGEVLWLSQPQRLEYRGETFSEFYCTSFPRIVDLGGDPPRRGVLVLAGGVIQLLDAGGKALRRADARIAFNHVAVDGRTMYLASSPNGDETIYRIDLGGDWVEAVEALERQGTPRKIGETLADLRGQVLRYEGHPESDTTYIFLHFWFCRNWYQGAEGEKVSFEERAERFHERFPYSHFRHWDGFSAVQQDPPLDENGEVWSEWQWNQAGIRGRRSVEELVAAAGETELDGVETLAHMGHGCCPFISLETAEKMLDAAPHALTGFKCSENSDPELLSRFLPRYVKPMLDLCASRGKWFSLNEKSAWWMTIPAIPECFETLFSGRRGRALLPCSEDSNSRSSELNLLARFGLRQAGLVGDFTIGLIADLFAGSGSHKWECPKHGHPYLRMLVAHTLLGGRYVSFRIPHLAGGRDTLAFSVLGRESTEIFLHMLGKGLVFAPRPEQMANVSPVGFAVHHPPNKWLFDAHNHHKPHCWQEDEELHQAVFPHLGCPWGYTETPAHSLSRVLLGKRRQGQHPIPATPYGVPVIVPAGADLSAVAGVEQWWHTDGMYVWREGGKRLNGPEAAEAVRESFETAAEALPFRTFGDDVFFHCTALGEGRHRLVAIDPGWVTPKTRRVSVRIQRAHTCAVTDVLSGERLAVRDGAVSLIVPAGSLRILEAEKKS
jgi:hypothetical protein